MRSSVRRFVFVFGVSLALRGVAHADSIFAIGNSLTWDSRPSLLEGDVQWQIGCNRNLADAFYHPGNTCVASSTNWNSAFPSKDYDYVMLQPFYGTTLTEDTEIISQIMEREPHAAVVIHTSWSSKDNLEQVYTSQLVDDAMRPSADYFERLIHGLRQNFPDRIVESDHVVDILYSIATDIHAGHAPFGSLSDLYRDAIHLNETGRYIAHNAARLALGQPLSDKGFNLAATTREYLDGKILSGRTKPSTPAADQLATNAVSPPEASRIADSEISKPSTIPGLPLELESSGELATAVPPLTLPVQATDLPPGPVAEFSVPEPDLRGMWLVWVMAVAAARTLRPSHSL